MGHTVSREELKEKIQINLGIYFYYPHFFKSVKEGNLCTCAINISSFGKLPRQTGDSIVLAIDSGLDLPQQMIDKIRSLVHSEEHMMYLLDLYLADSVIDGKQVQVMYIPKAFPPKKGPRLFASTPTPKKSIEEPISIADYLLELSMIPKDSTIALPLAYHHLDEFALVVSSDQADGSASSVNKNFFDALYRRLLVKKNDVCLSLTVHSLPEFILHPNLAPLLRVIETNDSFYPIFERQPFTLEDVLKFSREVLRSESNKTLFIFYQLLNVIAFCHQRGVVHGNINPSNIILNNDAWAMLTGFTCTDLASVEGNPAPDTPPVVKWVTGELSNYEYLLEVNRLAGRRWGDPTFHPIMPWVIDFKKRMLNDSSSSDVASTPDRGSISRDDEAPLSPRSGSGTFTWRDLTKTKYRLTKGDEQLDFMYNNAGAENTPHHVPSQGPDELSYYNYKSRVTPVKLLQKWVRGRYQANEYPKDLARLYNQSPDEAIPEFYSEPQIYFDLHPLMHELRPDDLEHDVLGDLQVPDWAQSVEDFVQKHRAALESDYVTSQMHTWLDLTFGQCLAGEWGVKHKNVALVSDTHLISHGFVKLWDAAHPRRPTGQTVSSARSLRVRQSPSIRRTPSAKKSFFEPRSTLGRIKNKLWSSDSDAVISGEELSEVPSSVPLSATSSGNTSPAMSATSSQTSLPLPQLPLLDDTSSDTSLAPYMLHSDLVKQLNAGKYHMDYIEDLMSCEHTEHFFQLSETLEPWYRAPVSHSTTLSEADLAKSNDIFSLGCVLYELYTGTPLYNKYKLTAEDKSSTIQATSSIPPAIRDLIADMTDPNPAHRPTAQALLVPLQASFKSAIRDIFPSYFQWLYKLLMTYHSLPSLQERLIVITDNLGEIIQMADDGFKLLMPCMIKFFDNEATQLLSLKLFESLALKLGRHQSIFYLRDCIISLYERQNQAQLQLELMGFKWTQLMLSKFGPSCFIKHFLGFLLSAVRSKAPNLANTASDTVLSLITSFSQPVYMKYFVLPLLAQTSKAYNEATFNTLTEMVPKLRAELLAKYFFEPLMHRIVKLTSSIDAQAQPGTNESLTSTIKLFEKCLDLVDGDMCSIFLLKELDEMNKTKPVIYLYTLLTTPPTCFQVTSLFKAFCSLLLIVAKKIGSTNAKKLAMPYVLKYFNTAQQAPAEAAKGDASAELVKSIYNPEVTSPLYAKFKSLIDSPSTTLDTPQAPSIPISPTALGFGLVTDDMAVSGGFENRMSWASLVSMSDKRPEFQGQTLATWREHVGAIKCLAVHDNERLFVSGSRDNMVKLWNIESMNSLITYSSHKQSITSVQFVDRGNLVASCDGNTIHIWELERGMQIMQLESEYGYSAFEPSDDGRSVIALLGNGAAVQAIELGTGRVTREWQIPTGQLGYAKTIAVYPRPYLFNAYHHSYHLRAYAAINKSRSFSKLQTITLGHSNGVVSVWDGLSGQLIESWRAHDGPISQVLPITAQVCLTASHDRSLVLWNRSETVNFNNPSEHIPKQIKVFKGHRDPVLGCDLLGSDMLSIAGHRISCANLDSHESAIKLNRIKLHKTSTLKPNQLTTLTALPLHQLALVGTEDGLIKLCN